MIDYFAIALTHGLIALAAWRLLARPDLDDDALSADAQSKAKPWLASHHEETGDGHG